MNWYHSLSIRTKLLIMALIVSLPAFGIIIFTGLDQRSEAIAESKLELEHLTTGIAAEVQHVVAATQQLCNAISLLPEIQSRNAAKLRPLLANILRLNPQYMNILVADLSGTAWVSALPSDHLISVADRRYFKNLLKTKQFSSGEFVIGRIKPRPIFSFSYPIYNQRHELSGMVIVSIDLERIGRQFENGLRKHSKINLTMSDHHGTVIFMHRANQPAQNTQIGLTDKAPFFHLMQAGPPRDNLKSVGFDGVERFITYQKLYLEGEHEPYLYIRSGAPIADTKALANQKLFVNIAVMVLCVLAALGIAWIYSTYNIVRRINQLQHVSLELANGDLLARVPNDPHADELGRLSTAFNTMANQLAQRELEQKQTEYYLRQNETRLAEAEALAHLGNFSWDLLTNEISLSDEMQRLLGCKTDSRVVSPDQFMQAIHPDDREQVTKLFHTMASYSDYAEYDYRVQWQNGQIINLKGQNTVIRDDNGIAVRMQGTAQDITDQVIVQHKLIEYQQALLELTDELARAGDRERHLIATELHDNIAQTLALCSIRLSAPNLDTIGTEQAQEVKLIKSRLDGAIETIRSMITRLSPPILHEMGLESALEWLLRSVKEEWGLLVTITNNDLPLQLSEQVSTAAFQIIRELLVNIAKHAGTDQAWLRLRQEHHNLLITVEDHGNGFSTDPPQKGFGLFSIRQRLHFLKGSLQIDSRPGEGTLIIVTIPFGTT